MELRVNQLPSRAPVVSPGNFLVSREWLRVFVEIVSRIQGDSQGSGILWGEGSPAGVVSANVGSLYLRTDGGAGSTLYVKESGSGTSAGWAAK